MLCAVFVFPDAERYGAAPGSGLEAYDPTCSQHLETEQTIELYRLSYVIVKL